MTNTKNYFALKIMNQILILQGVTVHELLQKFEVLFERKVAEIVSVKDKDINKYMTRKEVTDYAHFAANFK